ncbi:MAG TPA: hypothetical protein VKH42_15630, partial [Vicinamibacterales bacterium]|nr:hypothetical protein [Vicinamibacterales bacterium]
VLKRASSWIAVAAWLLFSVAFVLPAVEVGMGGRLDPGWQAAVAAAYGVFLMREAPLLGILMTASEATNVVMLLSPASIARRRSGAQLRRAAVLLIVAGSVNALWMIGGGRFGPGYYLWVASFGLMAAALLLRAREIRARAGDQTF